MINLAKNGSSRGAFFLCTAWPWWLVYLKSRLYVPMLISHHFRGAAGPKFNKFVTGLAKYSCGMKLEFYPSNPGSTTEKTQSMCLPNNAHKMGDRILVKSHFVKY